jgi:hypothetical protein
MTRTSNINLPLRHPSLPHQITPKKVTKECKIDKVYE